MRHTLMFGVLAFFRELFKNKFFCVHHIIKSAPL